MEGLIVSSIIVSTFLLVGLIFFLVKWHYKNVFEQTKHKASDAEVFKIIAQSSYFITSEQLAAATKLTKKEAYIRLEHLALEGGLRRYYDNNGLVSVFQLLDAVPLFESLPAQLKGLSDQEVVDVVLLHVDNYQVTLAQLVIIFGINIYEAKVLMKRLEKADKLTVLRKGFKKVYAVKKSLNSNAPVLRNVPKKNDAQKLAIPETQKIKIPDAEVLKLAIENNGRLTPTLLCVKLKISMDEAKMKLEDLYDQDVFLMQVNEENALLEYELRDKNLLS